MAIYVNILNDNDIIKLEKSDINTQIIRIKQEIREKCFIPINEQIIYFQSTILDNLKNIKDYTSDTVINLNLLILEKPFDVKLKSLSDKEIIIKNITSQTLIEEIFLILFYYYGLHPDDINLLYQNKILEKSKKLYYYNISDQSLINIIIKIKTGF